MARNGIFDDVAIDIMHGISQNKLEEKIDDEVDVNYIFSILEEYGRSIVRRHFCMETLKKANELQHMNDRELGMICDYLKPKVFEENAKVVEVGEPLNAMLYIIAGSMQVSLPIADVGEVVPSTSFETIEKGMFVGEQLLDWAAKTKTFDDQPASFKSVRCVEKVEAFALTVDDLETLVLSGDIFPMKSKAGILKIAADPKIREKLEAIFLWMEINGISDDVAIGIMHAFSENKLKENIHAEVDVNYIFSVLDECGRSIMRRHFCTEMLKKVKELRTMNDQALGTICDYLKPKMFEENAQVVEAGQPLNAMLYIITGSMQAYLPIRAAGEACPSTSFETLEKGMFVGKQLLDWAAKTKTFYDQPVSFKTVRCAEKVEAFALTVNDLKTLVVSRDIFQRSSKSEV
ncbi:putative cyclic nucleotide-gated ion channel 13 [Prunus persica]|uniref:putative cyclic nucleotide-gated ion channel 13 n=1 Tax=Prunus persica TaxID=3760 RepID=UPI0009AB3BC7|nr:putative cyclic nucleotide-gated ion channel 13 [Prunus persica]